MGTLSSSAAQSILGIWGIIIAEEQSLSHLYWGSLIYRGRKKTHENENFMKETMHNMQYNNRTDTQNNDINKKM